MADDARQQERNKKEMEVKVFNFKKKAQDDARRG